MAHDDESAVSFHEFSAFFIYRLCYYPDGTQVERTYTNRSQLNQLKYNSAVIDTRTYDIGGRLSTSTYSNGAVTTWNYRVSGANKDNLLANITTTNPGANKVGTYAYTWDANRNKTAETISNSPISGYGFSTGTNGYDTEDRVTAWNRSDSNQNQTWNLSLVGDWNTFNQAGTSPFNQTRTHGLAHEFTSFTGTNTGTLAYDVKGNLISRPATLAAPALNLTWDFDNRLGGADTDGTPASNEVTFQYDPLGRRVARTESGITTIFVQAGQQTFADYVSGAAPSSPTYRYVYGDYIDEPVMRETSSGSIKHFYHRNQQYSITALTDNNGNTAERYAYTASGVLTIFNAAGSQISISALSNRYTYTGREWDNALGMYYFRARWFEPNAGSFTNRDPLDYVDGMSLYRGYFGLGGKDPDGMACQSDQDPIVGQFDGGLYNPNTPIYLDETTNKCYWIRWEPGIGRFRVDVKCPRMGRRVPQSYIDERARRRSSRTKLDDGIVLPGQGGGVDHGTTPPGTDDVNSFVSWLIEMMGTVVPGSEFTSALEAAPDAACIAILSQLGKRLKDCLSENPPSLSVSNDPCEPIRRALDYAKRVCGKTKIRRTER